jgi:hypothetical protein
MKTLMRVWSGVVALAFSACSPVSDNVARQRTLALLPGASIESMHADGDDKVVLAKMPSGSVIEVELESDGTIEGLASEEGPWNFDIDVPDAIRFADAQQRALAAQAGTVEAWRYGAETKLWEFYVRSDADELKLVTLDSVDGSVKSVEAKDKIEI